MSARLHVAAEGEDVILFRISRILDRSVDERSPQLFSTFKYLVPPSRECLIHSFNIPLVELLEIGLGKLQRPLPKLLHNFGSSSSSFLLLRASAGPEQGALMLGTDHMYARDTGAQNRSHQQRKMAKRISWLRMLVNLISRAQLLSPPVVVDFDELAWAACPEEKSDELVLLADITLFVSDLYLPLLESIGQVKVLDPSGSFCCRFLRINQLRFA